MFLFSFFSQQRDLPRAGLLIVGLFILASCASYEVRTTDFKPVESLLIETPEELLLDIGIQIFEPDLQDIPSDEIVFVSVRQSEAIWVAQQLKTTLETSNAWGVVRVVPDDKVIMDLQVQGEVIQSDGETLALQVLATDTSGRIWIDQEYEQVISRYSYDASNAGSEPFQGLYNEIANDLLDVLRDQTIEYREDLRSISSVRFAQSFSSEAFDQYLTTDDEGYYKIDRLPAKNDPMLKRVQKIQLRDQMFVDVLQDYYVGFSANMDDAYREWRAQSYRETQIIRELEDSARARRIGGWLAIIGGVASQFDDNPYNRSAGNVAIYAGVEALKSSYATKDEAALHIETLSEMGQSLEAELEPSIIELQDRTVTLTGTVRNQYDDWRNILYDMYYAETGYAPPTPDTENGLL